MKLPERTPPIQLSNDNEIVRHVSVGNERVAAQGMCDYPGLVCGLCNNGSRQCTFPGSRSQFPCPC